MRNGNDDATEVVSAVDTQETVGYDGDDTAVMESGTIVEWTEMLMERFAKKANSK